MSFVLPVGIDFADGIVALPVQPAGSIGTPTIVGTPLPTADIFIYAANGGNVIEVEEPAGSPRIERAEQCTCEHTLKMSWVEAKNYWAQMGRGVIVNDTGANIWRILSCDITRDEATTGTLHYVMESISFDSPPDDFTLNDVSLDLNIIKHPRYSWALNPYPSDNATYTQVGDTQIFYIDIKQSIIRAIQSYIDAPFYPNADQVNGLIQNNIMAQLGTTTANGAMTIGVMVPNDSWNPAIPTKDPVPWDGTNANQPATNCQFFIVGVPYNPLNITDPITIAIAAAKELISKLWRQEDTPYIAGYEIVWTQRFFQPIYLNPGGYIEDPRGWVPAYFMDPEFSTNTIPRGNQFSVGPVAPPFGNSDTVPPTGVSGASIFDFMTRINPQLYATNGLSGGPLSISSLRKSDKYRYERTFFAIDHTWLIAPVGKWDAQLYTNSNRPQTAADFVTTY